MRPVFVPSLLHEPTGDPGLWIDLFDENRAILVDLGDVSGLATRKLLRVERVFVTHTHIDHFIGFDRLLRMILARDRELVLTGPPGFLACVRGKIAAYTWNLISAYPVRIRAEEVDGGVVRSETYAGIDGMAPQPAPDRPFDGALHAERLYTAHAAVLDHGIPVLGFAVRETERLAVNRDRLERLGLKPGPWLRDLKQAVRRCEPPDTPVLAEAADGPARAFRMAEIAGEILIRTPGQRIVYVTDFRFTPDNVDRVVALAHGADLLVCETMFAHDDEPLARERGHLTARQAGEIARLAEVRRLAPFHLSPRYKGRERELFAEAAAAFGGPIAEL